MVGIDDPGLNHDTILRREKDRNFLLSSLPDWLLYFWPSFLLVAWEAKRGWRGSFGSCFPWEIQKKPPVPGFGSVPAVVATEGMNARWKTSLSISCSLCKICLSKNNGYIFKKKREFRAGKRRECSILKYTNYFKLFFSLLFDPRSFSGSFLCSPTKLFQHALYSGILLYGWVYFYCQKYFVACW